MERNNVATFKGSPITLIGEEVRAGQAASDFKALDSDLKEVDLSAFKGKIKLIASVPSLDTPICDLQIKRFNDEAAKISKDVAIIFISMDLPFAQKRFCQAYDIKKVKTLSDHKEANFGQNYGVLIKELRLLSRAIFIVDKSDKVSYVEYVKELGSHPDYEAALNALKQIS
jgi:thiol peroxidase